MEVTIEGQIGNGKTLEDFARLIEQRRQLLNETTEQSVAACAIVLLRSLRATTKVADPKKPFSGELEEQSGLCLSFRSTGKGSKKRIPCLRVRGSGAKFDLSGATLVIVNEGVKAKNAKVFGWKRRSGRQYYLAAMSKNQAEAWVKAAEKRRIKKYRGLAKSALGRLMHKVAQSSGVSDTIDAAAQAVAEKNTKVEKQSSGFSSGTYSLTLNDQLKYAQLALQNPTSDIQTSLQKAMNAITATINKKCENVLGFERLDIPFPKN